MTQTIVYVSCAESREINVFSLASHSGEIQLCQRVPAAGAAQPLRVSPDKRRLYVGTRSENTIQTFDINPVSGEISEAGQISVSGSPTYLTCDRRMRVLFSAFYHDNALIAHPLNTMGIPLKASQIETDLPRAHSAVMDATNRWLLVATLGADSIQSYRLGDDLRLTPNNPAKIDARPGSGPRHLVFSPENQHVYCINELDGSIDLFDFDDTTGRLSMQDSTSLLPHGFTDTPWAAEIRISPDGRFLYTTERRSSMIATFAVAAKTGRLLLRGHHPTETQPRGMSIDPSGKWLVATGQLSGHLTVYALDAQSGCPTALHRHATGLGPIGVEIVDLT